jgi:hypothetical protein
MAISAGNAEHGVMQQATLLDTPVSLDRRRDQRADQERDQRQAPRVQLNHAALVSVVGEPNQVLHGEIRNLSEGGTQIRLDQPLPPFTLVRIEYDDSLLLGEVVYCQQEQSGWLVGTRVEHSLSGLVALATAMQRF